MAFKEETIHELSVLMTNYILKINKRRFQDEPWILEEEKENSPFNVRLIPSTIWKSSKYERSFVTGFGTLYEEMAYIIGKERWGFASKQYVTKVDIYESEAKLIQTILNDLDHKKGKNDPNRRDPNWRNELTELDSIIGGDMTEVIVNTDVYLFDEKNKKEAYIELKSPKPNKDQTKVSKEKMFKLYCGTRSNGLETSILYALPFNPWVDRLKYAHTFPETYFQMKTSPAVLMGKEFWNFVGKDEDTWDDLMALVEHVGTSTKEEVLKHLV